MQKEPHFFLAGTRDGLQKGDQASRHLFADCNLHSVSRLVTETRNNGLAFSEGSIS